MKTYIFRRNGVKITIDTDTLEDAYVQLEHRVRAAKALGVDVGSDLDFNLDSCF